MEDYVIKLLVFGLILWTTVFFITRRIFQRRSFDFSIRLVSAIHAIVAVILASLSVQDWSSPLSPLASKSSPKQMQALAVSASYLMFDLVCCQFGETIKIDTSIHHVVSIVGLLAGLAYERCGSEIVAALWITEISSPFLHLRDILKELECRNIALTLAVDCLAIAGAIARGEFWFRLDYVSIIFGILFTCARMIIGPYITYVILFANNPLIIKAMALGLQLVSAFWFCIVVRTGIVLFSGLMSSQNSIQATLLV